MNRLVQALFAQRESLIDTQAEATRRMAELEERIGRAQTNVERKIAVYEGRIGNWKASWLRRKRKTANSCGRTSSLRRKRSKPITARNPLA